MQAFPVDNTNMFEWPEVLSAAMHSVRTSMNLHPPVSRLHVPRDEQLISHGAQYIYDKCRSSVL